MAKLRQKLQISQFDVICALRYFFSPVASNSLSSLRGRRLKGMGKGVLGARETRGSARGGRKENPFPSSLLPPPSRVVSHPNSLHLPFRTSATQTTVPEVFAKVCSIQFSSLF